MSKTKLKKYLSSLDHDQIMQVVLDLYDARKDAKEYLEYYMEPDEEKETEKVKKNIFRVFFTPQGRTRGKVSLKSAADLIAAFTKLQPAPERIADAMLYLVEVYLTRTVFRGLVSQAIWDSIVKQFAKAAEYIASYRLESNFQRRVEKILDYTSSSPSYLNVRERMEFEMKEVGYEKPE